MKDYACHEEYLEYENNRKQKVIDRLSRKIQKLKGKKRRIDGAFIVANEYLIKYHELKRENDFLRNRENKLQMIEQMFKNEFVDLRELTKLVRGTK